MESLVETLIATSSLQQLCLDLWQLKMGLEENGTLTEVVHANVLPPTPCLLSTERVVSISETLIVHELTIWYVDRGNSLINCSKQASSVFSCASLHFVCVCVLHHLSVSGNCLQGILCSKETSRHPCFCIRSS